MNLITFDEAKSHLSVDHEWDDATIDDKRTEASEIVLDYLKTDTSASTFNWVDAIGEPTPFVPGVVKAATKLVLGGLYENREGYTDVGRFGAPQPLSQAVKDLLQRKRDPALA